MDEIIEIFGRKVHFDWDFYCKKAIKALELLKKSIKNPQVIGGGGYQFIQFSAEVSEEDAKYGREFYSSVCDKLFDDDIIRWLMTIKKAPEKQKMYDFVLQNAIEDKEWTKWRNKDLTGIYYHKFTFNEEIQQLITAHADEKIKEITECYEKYKAAEKQKEEAERKEKEEMLRGVEWSTEEKIITDEGGKTKEFFHIIKINGETYRFTERNVFDFGVVINPYPEGGLVHKRETGWYLDEFEKDKGWIDKRPLTKNELRAYLIVSKYGKYAHSMIRM